MIAAFGAVQVWEARSGFHICMAHAKFLRGQISERAVRAYPVVIDLPAFDGLPGIVQRQEPVFVQSLLTKLAAERFDVAVLHRATGVLKCSITWFL